MSPNRGPRGARVSTDSAADRGQVDPGQAASARLDTRGGAAAATGKVQPPGCDFCGLPVGEIDAGAAGPWYCCHGCRFAASITASQGDEGRARWTMTRLGLAIFFAMNVMVFSLFLWSQPTPVVDPLASALYAWGRHAALLFTLPVLLLLGGPLWDDAWSALRGGRASMSLLLVVGVAAAMAYSLVGLFTDGHVYFEVACAIPVAHTLGRWLEAQGKLQTTAALRELAALLPAQARVEGEHGEQLLPVEAITAGVCFRVLPGEHVAADGVVARRQAAVDEQAITGESLPVLKREGDRVLAGALVLDGPLVIRAVGSAGEGLLARMIAAVADAAAQRSRLERLADRASRWFLPLVAVVAAATFVGHSWWSSPGEGLLAALAVVVIACPCALGLATPLAMWAAVGRAARAGVLARDGDALLALARARIVCFDKTGTLTTGAARVATCEVFGGASPSAALAAAWAVARDSTHPLAQAVAEHAAGALGPAAKLVEARSTRVWPGRGVEGVVDGVDAPVLLGSRRWLREMATRDAEPSAAAAAGPAEPTPRASAEETGAETRSETWLAWGGLPRARFLFTERVRPGAAETLGDLRALGLRPRVLTGDHAGRAAALGAALGVDVEAELLPEDKLAVIRRLRQQGPVVMVGDGVNDAPALAAADVGVALGGGTDISRHSAPICLLRDDLRRLPWLTRLARQTTRAIRWNLLWAFGYNLAGVTLAAAGWLHPVIAAAAMGISGVLVVTNSLALARFEPDPPRPANNNDAANNDDAANNNAAANEDAANNDAADNDAGADAGDSGSRSAEHLPDSAAAGGFTLGAER